MKRWRYGLHKSEVDIIIKFYVIIPFVCNSEYWENPREPYYMVRNRNFEGGQDKTIDFFEKLPSWGVLQLVQVTVRLYGLLMRDSELINSIVPSFISTTRILLNPDPILLKTGQKGHLNFLLRGATRVTVTIFHLIFDSFSISFLFSTAKWLKMN